MPGEAMAVSAVANLMNKVVSWFIDPSGFSQLKRENQIEEITEALSVALDARAFDAADLLYAKLRELCANAGA